MKFSLALTGLLCTSFVFASPNCTVENLKELINPDTEKQALLKIEQMDKVVINYHEKEELDILKKELEIQKEFYNKNASPQLAKRIISTLEDDFPKAVIISKNTFDFDVARFMKNKKKAIQQIKAIQKKYNISSADCRPGSLSELGLNLELRQIDSGACVDIIANLNNKQNEASQNYLKSFEKASDSYRVPPKVNLEGLLYEFEGDTKGFSKKELEKIASTELSTSKLTKEKLKAIDDIISKGPYKVIVKLVKSKYSSVSINHKKRVITYKVIAIKNRICSPLYSVPELAVDKINHKQIREECWVR